MCACVCTKQGSSTGGHDILTVMNTLGRRLTHPFKLWKILPDRAWDAATARFDALVEGRIAEERSNIAAAAATATAATTGDGSSGGATASAGSAGDACLLRSLLQCSVEDSDAKGGRNVLSNKEASHIQHIYIYMYILIYDSSTCGLTTAVDSSTGAYLVSASLSL
jgi:hypothetical protein